MKAVLLFSLLSLSTQLLAQDWVELHNRVVNDCVSSEYSTETDPEKKEKLLGTCIWDSLSKIQEDTMTLITVDMALIRAELNQQLSRKAKAKLSKELNALGKELIQKSEYQASLKLLDPSTLDVGEIKVKLEASCRSLMEVKARKTM